MLTLMRILLTWEQDLEQSIYFAMTSEGDSVIFNAETEEFYFNDFNNPITRKEAECLILEVGA